MREKEVIRNRFLLLYASETGQAKAIAEEIADNSLHFGFKCDLYNINLTEKRFNITSENCVVFVVSTSGDGEPPEDARKFYRRLSRRTLNPDYLKNLNYTLLALGDSNYVKFCNFGCMLEKKLISLSAKSFYATGYGDDAFGIETGVDPWISNLWTALRKQLGLEKLIELSSLNTIDGESNISNNMTEEKRQSLSRINIDTEGMAIFSLPDLLKDVDIESLRMPKVPDTLLQLSFGDQNNLDKNLHVPNECLLVLPSSPLVKTDLIAARELTYSSDVKLTLELSLKFENQKVAYEPGDSFGFLCCNPEKEVTHLLERLNLINIADVPCNVSILEGLSTKKTVPKHITKPVSLREIFTSCIEIRAVPKKVLLRIFAEYATDKNDKHCLQLLSSQEGSKFYTDFIRKPSLSVLDILNIYKSCTPPIVSLIEYLPALRPRFYSVASSPLTDSSVFTVVFNLLQIPKNEGRYDDREGVCTGWLNMLSAGLQNQKNNIERSLALLSLDQKQIFVYKRKNDQFHFPKSLEVPVIMVGPGVGVAPFIGYLHHRERQLQTLAPQLKMGETWLFYGCRYEIKDFLYQKELTRLKSSNVLNHLILSFSRDESPATRYVYESIRNHAKAIIEAIQLGGSIYVCGDAKHMVHDVMQAFIEVCQTTLDLTLDDAKKMVDQLQKDYRYLNDVWI